MYFVNCSCGVSIEVAAVDAGLQVQCECGNWVDVPPLSELRRERPAGSAPLQADVEPSGEHPPIGHEFTTIMSPKPVVRRRIDPSALNHFLAAMYRTVEDFTAETPAPQPGIVQIGCALTPFGKILELCVDPEPFPGEFMEGLLERLVQLADPEVRFGPILFFIRVGIGEKEKWPHVAKLPLPFATVFELTSWEEVEHFLMRCALEQAEGAQHTAETRETEDAPSSEKMADVGKHPKRGRPLRNFIQRLFGLGRSPGRRRRSAAAARDAKIIAEVMEEAEQGDEPSWLEEAPTEDNIEALDLQIERHPDDPKLYCCRGKLRAAAGDADGALADFSQLVELCPQDASAYILRGTYYCSNDQLELGLADFNTSLRLQPQQPDARRCRASVYVELGALEPAEEDCTVAIDCQPYCADAYVLRAKIRFGREQYQAALDDLDQSLRIDPHNEFAYIIRVAVCQILAGQSDDREPWLARMESDVAESLRLNPAGVQSLLHRAELRLNQQRFDEVLDDCNRLLEIDPQQPTALGLRGVAYRFLDEPNLSLVSCSDAIELGFDHPEVFFSRAVAHYEMDEFELAMADVEQTLALAPEHVAARELQGLLKLAQGDVEGAVAAYDEVLRIDSTVATAWFHRGNANRVQGNLDEALADYNRCADLAPEFPDVYLNRALTQQDRGAVNEAVDDVSAAIALAPKSPLGYNLRAQLYAERSAWDEALQDLNSAIRLEPEFAPAYFTRGYLHLRQQRYEEALQDFDELIRLCPDLPAAHSGRAAVFMRMGQPEEADVEFDEAIRADPESAERYAIERLLVEASYLHESEQYQAATEKASEALELDEECFVAHSLRAAANWYSGNLIEADDDYRWLIEHCGRNPSFLNGRGQILAELGEYDEALELLDEAIQAGEQPLPPESFAYLLNGKGLALAGLQRYGEADDAFQKSLELCPDNGWTHYNRGLMLKQQGDDAAAATEFRHAVNAKSPKLPRLKRRRAKAYIARVEQTSTRTP